MNSLTHFKARLKLKLKEFDAYRHYIQPLTPVTRGRFAIVCDYRSGSTLLISLLSKHPDIKCDKELFLPFLHGEIKSVSFPFAYIQAQADKYPQQVYGFDLKTHQIIHTCWGREAHFRKIITTMYEKGWQFIYLRRLNLVKQALSNILANQRQKWKHLATQDFEREKVYIDCEVLQRTLGIHDTITKINEVIFSNFPHCEVIYERDLQNASNHQATVDRIFTYLDLESVPTSTQLRRVSASDWAEDVQNIDEVIAFLSNSPYCKYLDLLQI